MSLASPPATAAEGGLAAEQVQTVRNMVIPDVGDIIAGRYRLDGVLGRGGFGIVFSATHLEMSRVVALKTLLPQVAMSQDAVSRFRQEAVLAAGLRHPNTITLFDYGQTTEGLLYLVMEYLQGQTLKDRMRRGRLTQPQVRAVLVQVLKSLSEAHGRGIIHRDLKPENIFLCEVPGEQDFVKVLDFGVAKMIDSGPVSADADLSAGASFGTPRYMAPEQISGAPLGTYTDLYALGLIAYEALLGQPAFDGRTPLEIIAKQANAQPPQLPAHLRMTPVGQVIERCMIKDPTRRFQAASEALDVLHEVQDLGQVSSGAFRSSNATHSAGLPTAGWGFNDSGPVDSGRFLSEGVLDDSVGDEGIESSATVVQMPGDSFDSGRYLSEGSLVDNLGEMENEATRLEDGIGAAPMAPEPTMIAPGRLSPLPIDPMESESTRVKFREETVDLEADDLLDIHTAHRVDVAARAARADLGSPVRPPVAPAPAPAPAGRHRPDLSAPSIRVPRHPNPPPPEPMAPRSAPPAAEDSSVLFSVAHEAAAYTPGVPRSAPDPSLTPPPVGVQRAANLAAPGTTNHGHTPPPRRAPGLDRNLVVALAMLGLGLIAVMLVATLYLLRPFIGLGDDPTPTATPIAEGGAPLAETVLAVTSSPAGAEVLVDGRVVGVTPMDIKRPQPRGVIGLIVRKVGFEDHSEELTYDGNQEVSVTLKASGDGEEVSAKEADADEDEERPVAAKAPARDPKPPTPKAEVAAKATPPVAKPKETPPKPKEPAAKPKETPPKPKETVAKPKETPPKPKDTPTRRRTGTTAKKNPFGKW